MKKLALMIFVRFSVYIAVVSLVNHFFQTGFILGFCVASVVDREFEWLTKKAFG